MKHEQLYSELGKLIYAIANIDGVITQKERDALLNIVTNELIPAENQEDNFGTNTAHYSEIEFEFLEEQISDSDSAFNSFVDFIDEHHSAFDKNMIKVCLHIVDEISSAYRKTNKKEKQLIDLLKQKLERINLEK